MTNGQPERNAHTGTGAGGRPMKLTPLLAGLILGLVALVVLCCLGWAVLAAFAPNV